MSYKVATVRTFEVTTPSTVWNIQHNMGVYPIVDVYVDNNGMQEKIIPTSVEYVSANECELTFSTARAGFVVIV